MPRPPGDSVVVVTGASSGIGRATAHAFARHGAAVVLASRDEGTLEEAAQECRAAGGRALAVPTDVCDEAAVEALAERAVEAFGRIDVWVNNAGVILYGGFEETPSDAWRQVIETNLFGQVYGARVALPRLREAGGGCLVNVASVWGRVTSPYVSAYVTSKFAVRAFTECLRQAVAEDPRLHVCTVLPESVDTPIFRKGGNYTGRGAYPVPPLASAERAAQTIVGCVERPRREVSVGRAGPFLAAFHGVARGLYARLAPHALRISALGPEDAEHTRGNLHAPMPEWNRVHGGWRGSRLAVGRRMARSALREVPRRGDRRRGG